MKKLISIVSGCYNEEENLPIFHEEISKIMDSLPQYDFECLIADNCSKDRSAEILEKIAQEDKRFKIVFNLKNYGPDRSGGNLLYRAKGDAIICLASDLQDPPELIPVFLKKWEEGNKLVWGQREKSEENWFMESLRCLYYWIIRRVSENEEIERANGFGLYDREVVDWIRAAGDPVPYVRNMVTDLGYQPYLVLYTRRARTRGKSSYNLFRYVGDAMVGLVATSRVPLRIATYLGFLAAGGSLTVAIIYMIYKLSHWQQFDVGTAPTVIGLFFLGAIQLICTGMVGEYVGDILMRVKHRPMVIERKTLNFDDNETTETIEGEAQEKLTLMRNH